MSILSNRLFCDRIDMNWKIHIILHNKLVSYLQLSIIYKIKINHSMNILYLQPMSWIQGSFAFVFRENRVGSIVPTPKCESWNIRAMDSELFFYSNYDCKNYMQIEKLNTTSHCVNIKKKLQRYQISCMVRHVSQNVTHLAGVLKVDVQSL